MQFHQNLSLSLFNSLVLLSYVYEVAKVVVAGQCYSIVCHVFSVNPHYQANEGMQIKWRNELVAN